MSGTTTPIVQTPTAQPPIQDKTITSDTGKFSTAWSSYFQYVSSMITQLSQMRRGVTDGSEATAGDIGEYMTATGTVSLASATVNSPTQLTLTAGDWDVGGNVVFSETTANVLQTAVGIDGTFSGSVIAQRPAGSGVEGLATATVRRNVTGDTTVQLIALAAFSGGGASVLATGTIWARRAR